MSNLFQLSSKVLLYPELSEIIDRIVASLEVRSAAKQILLLNQVISSVFRDLLIPFKLITKIFIGLSQSCACSLLLAKTNEKDACFRVPQSSSLPQSCAKEKSSGFEIG